MANRKLKWWARLTFRKTCGHCGELYATTTLPADGLCSGELGCEYCAAGYASGRHEDDWDDTLWRDAMDALPWLLRHRPGLRLLKLSAAMYDEAQGEREKEHAYEQLCRDYAAALRPVRWAYTVACWWDEARFNVGIEFDRIRLAVSNPKCSDCGAPATTTTRISNGTLDGLPVCGPCTYVIGGGAAQTAGGAR